MTTLTRRYTLNPCAITSRSIELDGRTRVARRLKRTIGEIKNTLGVGRRLSNDEIAAVERAALASVMAEVAMAQALTGTVPVVDATRAASNARRARSDLAKAIKPKPERELTLREMLEGITVNRRNQGSDHAGKFRERLRENTEAAGLPDTPVNRQRIEDATWVDLATDATRAAILRGQAVEVSALERLVAARNAILPSATVLNVNFVEAGAICPKCQQPTTPLPAPPQPVAAEATPDAPAPAPAIPPPPVPSNVTPLRKPEPTQPTASAPSPPARLLEGNSIAELVASANTPASGPVTSLPQDGRDSR